MEEAFADLLRTTPGIERVIPVAQRRWRKARFSAASRSEWRAAREQLRQQPYDAVIDFRGLVKSAWVARQARLAPGGFSATFGNKSELCGYEWPVRFLLQRAVPMPTRIHAVARTRLLAARALGYDAPGFIESPPTYPWTLRAAAVPPQVVLAHGTTRADNEWPAAARAEFGRRLAAEGFELLVPQAGDSEERFARQLAADIGPQARVLPRMRLAELLEVMRGTSALVGVDSGIAHMAVALNLPVVEIFSQPRAWRAGPVGRPHQCAVGGDAAPSVAEVASAWQACWQQRPQRAIAS
ncbi:lipopolysaccharide heptosyltransferase I [Ramlibacter terrae]|uniref:Lipopolysaccharide heptosyltransferase 1 n=1 Tax=Ramlibacter terrae TaxID=2732511 RepID=A0ABX6P1N4_9BURK|nr:lipopolysaccharide heptosyltransferase I [Ramlibacter terrae]